MAAPTSPTFWVESNQWLRRCEGTLTEDPQQPAHVMAEAPYVPSLIYQATWTSRRHKAFSVTSPRKHSSSSHTQTTRTKILISR